MTSKIKIGISACLLGKNVRWNGKHKFDELIVKAFEKHFELVPVCPETECGLTTPRETMHLVESPAGTRIKGIKSRIDHTDKLEHWAEKKLTKLETEPICGFIFKGKSPSCGLYNVNIHNNNDDASAGRGLFAKAFATRFPNIPIEEDTKLHNIAHQAQFIEMIFRLRER